MGRAADAIASLESQLATANQTIATQQTALTAAQANEYDAADDAAINAVLTPPAATVTTTAPAPATAPSPVATPTA